MTEQTSDNVMTETEVLEEATTTISAHAQWKAVDERKQHASQRLSALAELARTGVLTDDEEDEQLRLERRLENLKPVLERWDRDRKYERATLNTEEILAHYDAYRPQYEPAVAMIAQGMTLMFQGVALIGQTHTTQFAPIAELRTPQDKPAIEVKDQGEVVANVVGAMPAPAAWKTVLLEATARLLTNEDGMKMLDAIPGTKPFNPRQIENYLKLFTETQR